MSKIVSLAPKNLKLTYIEAIMNHVDMLTDEQKNAQVECMVLSGLTKQGCMYSVLDGGDLLQILGLLDVTKLHLYEDFVGGYDD